jgi:hypothetical protein
MEFDPSCSNSADGVDTFRRRLTANGTYIAALAYKAFLYGRTTADYAQPIWENTAPLKEKNLHVAGDEQ